MSEAVVELVSELRASAEEVWAHATTMAGVNEELAPWVKMSVPHAVRGKTLRDIVLGEEAFVSMLLAGGVLPFDAHHLKLIALEERAFVEESWSWLQRRWRHVRTITPTASGCTVRDKVTFEPRFGPAALVAPIVRALFVRRHRVLRRRFG